MCRVSCESLTPYVGPPDSFVLASPPLIADTRKMRSTKVDTRCVGWIASQLDVVT